MIYVSFNYQIDKLLTYLYEIRMSKHISIMNDLLDLNLTHENISHEIQLLTSWKHISCFEMYLMVSNNINIYG